MLKENYNQFYKKYGPNVHSNPERFLALSNLCKGRVLDIGCGTGDLADFTKKEYKGVDISDVAIKMALEHKRPKASYAIADFTQPFEMNDFPFDTAVMAEFLEHIDDDRIVFLNLKKWLKKDGRIIISVPNGDRVQDPNHLRQFTIPELKKRFSPLGQITFYNWSGAYRRILMTIDLGKKNSQKISLVMIVKNEEKGLERAILSCIEFTDDIVISVDTESEDRTLEIAQMYANTLKQHEWKNDFAEARNFAQNGVKTDWILVLDGHEYVEQADNIRNMLETKTSCLMVKVTMENGDAFFTPRIFRNGIAWKHAIHNAIHCDTMLKYPTFIIKHDRTGGQTIDAIKKRKKQRDETMERLLLKELREDQTSLRAIFYLARWYFTAGKLKKAIKFYKKYLKKGGPKGENWYCAFELAIAYNALGKQLKALKSLDKAEKEVPNRWEKSKMTGLTYMSFGRWQKAAEYLVDSFKVNTGDFAFYPLKRDDAETWDLIGYCFYQLKNYKKAKISWQEAIKKDEDKERIKLNQRRIELIDNNLIF